MSKYVGFRLGKVHESHVISEYYCGGCGWPVTDHDSFCPECGGAFRECDASNLEDENAKLRERAGHLFDAVFAKNNELIGLLCEVEKLRELVKDMWEGYNDHRCEECHLKDTPTCADCSICAREAAVIDRMRELGVEVDW